MAGLTEPRSVSLEDAHLVEVTATLQQGFSAVTPWPLPLDALLASVWHRRRFGDRYGGDSDYRSARLPLRRAGRSTESGGKNRRWWWAASAAIVDGDERESHHWHRRMPHQRAEEVTASRLPANIYDAHGRYRLYRVPISINVASEVRWYALGDAERIEEMVRDIPALGHKRSQGEGAVLRWSVTDHDASRGLAPILWHPETGLINRPVAIQSASALGLDVGVDRVTHVYRPPYFWRTMQAPTNPNQDTFECIAPWVRRPDADPVTAS